MQFPSRDLTNQYISSSYQDVVQYYASESVSFLLDGLGYVIVGIPSSSLGNTILTQDQTASWAVSASWAPPIPSDYSVSSSWASQSLSASWAPPIPSDYAVSASWASESFHSQTTDVSISSSYALYSELSNTSSIAIIAEFADTSSIAGYALSSDVSISSSWASQSLSASWAPNNPIISASWASHSISSISSSYASSSTLAFIADVALLADTASFAVSASYAPFTQTEQISASWASSSLSSSWTLTASFVLSPHVEKGIISGSTFTGSPRMVDILFSNPFISDSYTISVIGDEARIWSTENRSNNGFTINTNSNATLSGMIMWRAEEI